MVCSDPHAGFSMRVRRLALILALILETARCPPQPGLPPMPAYIISGPFAQLTVAGPVSLGLLSSVASLTAVTANNGSESELGLPVPRCEIKSNKVRPRSDWPQRPAPQLDRVAEAARTET